MKTILIMALIALSGCASTGMNASCTHVNGNELTVPYVGGKADGSVFACHIGCVGMNCPKASYADIATLTDDYIKSTSNAITTTVPMYVTISPSK